MLETKFGFDLNPVTGMRASVLDSRPDRIRRAVDAMPTRSGTDRIDTLAAGGKMLHLGMSWPVLETVRRAHAGLPLSVIRIECLKIWRGPEKAILP
ncbi:hypothetical protein PVT71_26220 (plasmid) [Salipiger sp. H15]|uniref:Uncharacterized protein n=1 Tax=Alloyangia sp. H15 TaxID=3029062 RepID=A0AAU8ARY5_9RHOB